MTVFLKTSPHDPNSLPLPLLSPLRAREIAITAGLSWISRLIRGDCPQRSDATTTTTTMIRVFLSFPSPPRDGSRE